uniref:Cytochrome b5 heme-binding domain-containing protein n=1 Tax=viral metagenome TaxID=1070528 RepID=A0A6C0BEJ1_9ZZZZ
MWSIHGKKYDLSTFKNHPGGDQIIEMTKDIGDITAIFESYHAFSDKEKIMKILDKYSISDGISTISFKSYDELVNRVKEKFPDRKSIKSTNILFYKVSVLIMLYIITYYISLYSSYSLIIKCICSFLAGAFKLSVSFNILHDASHYAISVNPEINNILSKISNSLILWNSNIWFYHHVYKHHSFTLMTDVDPDTLHFYPFFRKDKESKSKANLLPTSKNPSLWAWFVLGVFPGFFLGQAISYVFGYFKKNLWRIRLPKNITYYTFFEICLMSFSLFNLYHGLFLQTFIYLLTANIFYHINIFANHDTFETMENKYTGEDWLKTQICNSGNFINDNLIWTHLFGGINYQIEHHLFPNMAHEHLITVAPIVKQFCLERNIPYVHHTLTSAYLSFLKMLNANKT